MSQEKVKKIVDISLKTIGETVESMLGKEAEIDHLVLLQPSEIQVFPEEVLQTPMMAVEVVFAEGIKGRGVLLLGPEDAFRLANMQVDASEVNVEQGFDSMDFEKSAMEELSNQMFGASCYDLTELLGQDVNIKAPDLNTLSSELDFERLSLGEDYLLTVAKVTVGSLSFYALVEVHKDIYLTKAPKRDSPAVEVESYNVQELEEEDPVAPSKAVRGQLGSVQKIPVEITVEIGRAKKKIREILELGKGSIIELDKLAGEPADMYVNGTLMAKGEIVVIKDNFGFRVAEIVDHSQL